MQLSQNLKKQIISLFSSNHHITKVILFGSRARGDADERSDIDLAIQTTGMNDREKTELTYLAKELDTLLPMDIIWLDEASQPLKDQIARDGVMIYELDQNKSKHPQPRRSVEKIE